MEIAIIINKEIIRIKISKIDHNNNKIQIIKIDHNNNNSNLSNRINNNNKIIIIY